MGTRTTNFDLSVENARIILNVPDGHDPGDFLSILTSKKPALQKNIRNKVKTVRLYNDVTSVYLKYDKDGNAVHVLDKAANACNWITIDIISSILAFLINPSLDRVRIEQFTKRIRSLINYFPKDNSNPPLRPSEILSALQNNSLPYFPTQYTASGVYFIIKAGSMLLQMKPSELKAWPNALAEANTKELVLILIAIGSIYPSFANTHTNLFQCQAKWLLNVETSAYFSTENTALPKTIPEKSFQTISQQPSTNMINFCQYLSAHREPSPIYIPHGESTIILSKHISEYFGIPKIIRTLWDTNRLFLLPGEKEPGICFFPRRSTYPIADHLKLEKWVLLLAALWHDTTRHGFNALKPYDMYIKGNNPDTLRDFIAKTQRKKGRNLKLKLNMDGNFSWGTLTDADIIENSHYVPPNARKLPPGHHMSNDARKIASFFNETIPPGYTINEPFLQPNDNIDITQSSTPGLNLAAVFLKSFSSL